LHKKALLLKGKSNAILYGVVNL
jgi:hypothetical protein